MMKLEKQALTNIIYPRDTDVLCGRGGAVTRHPGNKNYLDLVNRNKGHYYLSLSREKNIISRSIVVAIRELRGRFLEKNKIDGTWSDIGDKKATGKTSQALRERQSEMRQNVSGALEESHFAIGSEPEHWIMSDFSLMSGMSMDAFLDGIFNLSKTTICSLSGGMDPDTDRCQVFAGMKSTRAPSIGEPRGPNGPVSQLTMDDALDVQLVESYLSLCSNMSID
jgi:hypothetical protein